MDNFNLVPWDTEAYLIAADFQEEQGKLLTNAIRKKILPLDIKNNKGCDNNEGRLERSIGHGFGDGYGHGFSCGYSEGCGDGDGLGHGSGNGDGEGFARGYGYGYGYGSGNG